MFTGIVQSLGNVISVKSYSEGSQVEVSNEKFCNDLLIGESIAVNGVCSTLINGSGDTLMFDYLPETLSKTNLRYLVKGDFLNLERSMSLSDRIGGHLVSGHVDTTGTFTSYEVLDKWGVLTVHIDSLFMPLISPKCSICIDGISLTVVKVSKTWFTVHIIPHTYLNTHLKFKKKGDTLNLEFDPLLKAIFHSAIIQDKFNYTSEDFNKLSDRLGYDYEK